MHSRLKELALVVGLSVLGTLVVIALLFAAGIGWFREHRERGEAFLERVFSNDERHGGPIVAPMAPEKEMTVVDAVKKANPAVVAIAVSKDVPKYEQYMRNVPSPFGDFFNFQVPDVRQNGTEHKEIGGGSGFLVSNDGYIVTNRHVVDDADAEYTVLMNDGKKFDAKVIARDQKLDIAVIKIEGADFPYLEFGDSDKIEIGQTVIAIGNALAQFRNTVSVGVVSGLSRDIVAGDSQGNSESLDTLIQTDAAINPGNSGGPLLSTDGEVIGVNVAIAGNAQNIGFALTANSVKNVIESVKKNGKIVEPYLGVRYVPITKDIQQKNALSVDYGDLVLRGSDPSDLAVIPGSPADKAGIVENDIILEADGQKLDDSNKLTTIIGGKKVGDSITLKLLHRGDEKTITVTLAEMPQQ